jgi:hypothetical protein
MGRRSLITSARSRQAPGSYAGGAVEALGNYALCSSPPHTQTQTNAGKVGIIAVALQAKYSGIFRVSCRIGFSDGTTAKTTTHALVGIPFAAPAARFTGGANAGVSVGRDVVAGLTASAWGQVLNADSTGTAASGIEFNATPVNDAAAGAVIFCSEQTVSLTGLLTAQATAVDNFGFDGIVGAAAALPATPFPKGAGQFVVFGVELIATNAGDVVTYSNAYISAQELPPPG